MNGEASYTLRYRSSRREVWRTYWRGWRKSYWRIQLSAVVALAATLIGLANEPLGWKSGLHALLLALPMVLVPLLLWPQLRFKSQERWLQVGAAGWSTRIGRRSGARTWTEVAGVACTGDAVLIASKAGGILIVPLRAFGDAQAMRQFFADVRRWHGESGDSQVAGGSQVTKV